MQRHSFLIVYETNGITAFAQIAEKKVMRRINNRVQLIGNLGADPKVSKFDKNEKVELSLATNESYTNKAGEKIEETQWHRIVGWGKQAEIAEKYLKKGSKLAVDGKLVHRSYEDGDGTTKYVTEVKMEEFMSRDAKSA